MSLLRIAGSQMTDDLQQRHFFGDAPPNRRRKSGSLKEPLFRNIMGPFTPDESQTFKAVVGHGLYPLHPALASPVRFVYSPPRRPLTNALFSRRRMTA